MDLKLAAKRALVTRSSLRSAGLGEVIAKLLAAEGVAVITRGRDGSGAKAVAHAISGERGCAEITLGALENAGAVPSSLLDGSNAGSLHRND
jgi:3-oxoacyl-[acyl-carrier protein] reductase